MEIYLRWGLTIFEGLQTVEAQPTLCVPWVWILFNIGISTRKQDHTSVRKRQMGISIPTFSFNSLNSSRLLLLDSVFTLEKNTDWRERHGSQSNFCCG